MDVLKVLEEVRRDDMAIWQEYHDRARTEWWLTDMRNLFELRVRALDYAMEALRHDTV